ncbi:MAG: chain length determinant protein tyrosine kinase EpsG [Burkholderiales bacterium]
MKNNQTMQPGNVIPGPGVAPVTPDRSIGAMLIDAGKISAEDAERILRHAKEKSLRFGDAAMSLRLATETDIQQVLARQFDYPYLLPGQSDVSPEVVAAWTPFNQQVEALRALRSQLLLRWFTGAPAQRSLAVVSPDRGDGRTHLAANLAVVFSQMGERTLLVDADLRGARQHELFGVKNSVGLSTVLAERARSEAIQRVPGFVDLSILPAGPTPPNPLELLGRGTFGDLIQQSVTQFDVVIIDTPAAAFGSDYQLVAQQAKGALAVARLNRTPLDACKVLAEEIRAAGAAVVGGVVNER